MFSTIIEAIKASKTSPFMSVLVHPQSVTWKSREWIDVTLKHFKEKETDKVSREFVSLSCAKFLQRIILGTLTKKPSAYSFLASLSPNISVQVLNDVFLRYKYNIQINYRDNELMSMLPEFYSTVKHEAVLSGFINDEMTNSFVDALLCDITRMMRIVCTPGDSFSKSKAGVVVLNSEIGMLDIKKHSAISLIAHPCLWYPELQVCSILPSSICVPVTVRQMHRSISDIIFDFMVELEIRKPWEKITDKHKNLLVSNMSASDMKDIKLQIKRIDPILYKKMKSIFEKSLFDIYSTILMSTKNYAPHYRIKLEKIAGLIYSVAR